jgi:hypothetical protein
MNDRNPGFLGAFGRFFFTPTDPSTLGLMRIMTGLVVLYTHLVYSLELPSYMGPTGWWNQDIGNRIRHEQPINQSTLQWPTTMSEARNWINVDNAPHRREAELDFLRKLPEDLSARRKKLDYLIRAYTRTEESETQTLLRLPNSVLKMTDEQLERTRKLLAADAFKAEESHLALPESVRLMPAAGRLEFWESLIDFTSLLADDTQQVEYVLLWLSVYAREGRQDLLDYFLGTFRTRNGEDLSLPASAEDRAKILDYIRFWGQDPRQATFRGLTIFSPYFHVSSPTMMWTVHVVCLGIFVLFTLGLWTRVTSVLTWIATLAYIHRANSLFMFGQDTMQNILLVYLTIAPSGAAFSLDAIRARRRAAKALFAARGKPVAWANAVLSGPAHSVLANFVLRLLQLHYGVIYLSSGLSKLKGQTWWDHRAAWYTLSNFEFTPIRYDAYEWLMLQLVEVRPVFVIVCAAICYGTLMLEISMIFLVWTRLRMFAVSCAVMLHVGIALIMGLSVFAMYMFALLLCYFPAALIRERVVGRQGGGRKMTLLYDGASDSTTLAALTGLRAADLFGQITFVDRPTGGPGGEILLTEDDGTMTRGPLAIDLAMAKLESPGIAKWLAKKLP